MPRTITSTYSTFVFVTASADNPLTIAAAAALDAGLYLGRLASAWTVTNAGRILGGGITLESSGTIDNGGTIASGTGSGAGIFLMAGGAVTNRAAGTISGFDGAFAAGAAMFANYGQIHGASTGVAFGAGGTVTNATSALIGGYLGISAPGGALTVVNAGTIAGSAAGVVAAGVQLGGGGSVINLATGTLTGYNAVVAGRAPATVTNAGTIGGARNAVRLAAGVANRVIDLPGAVFAGTVDGGNGIGANAVSTLELGSGATTGTLGGFGTQFVHFGQVVVDAGASWTLQTSDSIASGITWTNAGTLNVPGTATNAGLITGSAGASYTSVNSAGGSGQSAIGTISGLLTNSGDVFGGAGGYSRYGSGGPGGTAIAALTGSLANTGLIGGGTGGGTGGTVPLGGTAAANLVVAGRGGDGVVISGGMLTNTGSITGGAGGFGILSDRAGNGGTGVSIATGTLLNSGTIRGGTGGYASVGTGGTGGSGIYLVSGSLSLTSSVYGGAGGGSIYHYQAPGGTGVQFGAGGTLVTDAPVSGGSSNGSMATAIDFGTGAADLVLQAGAKIHGAIIADPAFANTVELKDGPGGSGFGTVDGLRGFQTATVDRGSYWYLAGVTDFGAGSQVTNLGGLANSGTLNIAGTLIDARIMSGSVWQTPDASAYTTGKAAAKGYNAIDLLSGAVTVLAATGAYLTTAFYAGNGQYSQHNTGGNGGSAIGTLTGILVNAGRLLGGVGGYSGGQSGGAGGNAVNIQGGTLINTNWIRGGAGGSNSNKVRSQSGAGVWLGSGTIVNRGTILGGVGAYAGGYTSIVGAGGTGIYVVSGTITNYGSIIGGLTTPWQTRMPSGGAGVLFKSGGTLTTAGLIGHGSGPGPAQDAIAFGTGAARLIVMPSASFIGSVVADATFGNVLEFTTASGGMPASGTFSQDLGVEFQGFGTIAVDAGASWTLASANSLTAGVYLGVAGTLANDASLTNGGTIGVSGSLVNAGTISGYGFAPNHGAGSGIEQGNDGVNSVSGQLTNTGAIAGAGGPVTSGPTGWAGGAGLGSLTGTLINAGWIVGGSGSLPGSFGAGSRAGRAGDGVDMAGGLLTNSGTISGGSGRNLILISQAPGRYAGDGGTGVMLNGGTLDNTGLIRGGYGGLGAYTDAGNGGTGLYVTAGTLIDLATVIGGTGGTSNQPGDGLGGVGVSFKSGGTITAFATIAGGAGQAGTADAIDFGAGASDLVMTPTSVVRGAVVADAAFANTLELSGTTGTLTGGIGTGFQGFGLVTIDANAHWVLTGDNQIGNLTTLTTGSDVLVYVQRGHTYDHMLTASTLDVSGGALDVTGNSASLRTIGVLRIGEAASGLLAIGSGASAVSEIQGNEPLAAVIGDLAAGTASVSGGATWQIASTLEVGASASGTLAVTAGGQVTAATIDTGVSPGASGQISVIGSGAALAVGGTLILGESGSGALSVLNGGSVSAAVLLDGTQAGSAAVIAVSGSQSVLRITDHLALGAGTLILGDAATLAVGNLLSVGANGAILQSGGTIDPVSIVNQGTIGGTGTDSASGEVDNAGTVYASAGRLEIDAPVIHLGSLTGSGVLRIGDGGDLVVNAAVDASQNVVFATGTGVPRTLEIGAIDGGSVTAIGGFTPSSIENFAAGDTIIVTTGSLATFSQGGSVVSVIGNGGGTVGVLTFDNAADASAGVLLDNVVAGDVTCFVAGTRIATPDGERQVETIQTGDLVATESGPRPVRWIGYRNIDLHRHPDPVLARPIRIRHGAIGPNQPARDLLVSPDHAILVEGALIPARLLVNGASITIETQRRLVTYYHLELDRHALLLADGLLAESYLDTGNRGLFENGGRPVMLHPDLSGAQDRRDALSCRPLLCDPPAVEPVWRGMAKRAGYLGYSGSSVRMTHEPELVVRVGGRTIRPVHARNGRNAFVLPATRQPARLVSRSAVPSALRPWIEDRRRLGVMVQKLEWRDGAHAMSVPMDAPALTQGWWAAETDGRMHWRWTDGDAELPVFERSGLLHVTLGEAGPYPLDAGLAVA